MKKLAINLLLLTALVLPVALFWLIITRVGYSVLVASVIAVAAGWTLNVAWAFAVSKTTPNDPLKDNSSFLPIAARFGWVCPSVLVLLTWLVWHFTTGSAG